MSFVNVHIFALNFKMIGNNRIMAIVCMRLVFYSAAVH